MAERLNTLSNIIQQSSRLRTVRATTKLDAK
jgi:acyl-CoA oxidase